MKTITLEQIEATHPCSSQWRMFKRLCGKEVKVTYANARKLAHKLNISWAAWNLLTEDQYILYQRIYHRAPSATYKSSKVLSKAVKDQRALRKLVMSTEIQYREATAASGQMSKPARAARKKFYAAHDAYIAADQLVSAYAFVYVYRL